MGLKREHKESLETIQKKQEISLFNLRGEQAEKLCSYDDKIKQLEAEIDALKKVGTIFSSFTENKIVISSSFDIKYIFYSR